MAKKPIYQTVYLFHGGGALGAYQVGVFKGLQKYGYVPDWLIGSSIGAINSAIIAGNKPEHQLKKMEDFWYGIATNIPPTPDTLNNLYLERAQHMLSANYTEFAGQPGFFKPRLINPWLGIQSTADQLSYYDTSELRETLKRLIDFDLINQKKTRLSMGAVHISTGRLVYFDNTKIELTVDHVMASCALPPGLPAVRIGDQYYWDGGVHSNNQLSLLLETSEPINYLCFMVHLFDSYGIVPTNMDEVYKRQKDILYSSHHKQAIQVYRYLDSLKQVIRVLGDEIPKSRLNDPDIKKLLEYSRSGTMQLTRFHCEGKPTDLSSKDYDFALPSIESHIKTGYADVCKVFPDPPWGKVCPYGSGLNLYEITDTPVSEDGAFEVKADYYLKK